MAHNSVIYSSPLPLCLLFWVLRSRLLLCDCRSLFESLTSKLDESAPPSQFSLLLCRSAFYFLGDRLTNATV
uniref:Secreted protein n=1 Tax=Kalanchoe fedtschenkoi TaxID=63787 RepID=A0A7N0ZS46_KALFE